jgi:hypothetical protein
VCAFCIQVRGLFKPMLGMFHGEPRGKKWRAAVSEQAQGVQQWSSGVHRPPLHFARLDRLVQAGRQAGLLHCSPRAAPLYMHPPHMHPPLPHTRCPPRRLTAR